MGEANQALRPMIVDEASQLPSDAPLGAIAFVRRLDSLVVRRAKSWNVVEPGATVAAAGSATSTTPSNFARPRPDQREKESNHISNEGQGQTRSQSTEKQRGQEIDDDTNFFPFPVEEQGRGQHHEARTDLRPGLEPRKPPHRHHHNRNQYTPWHPPLRPTSSSPGPTSVSPTFPKSSKGRSFRSCVWWLWTFPVPALCMARWP